MVWPGIIFLIVFCYVPMYGIVIAFKDYTIGGSIIGAPWVGFKYIEEFFTDENFFRVVRNALGINILGLVIGFPAPIIFALLLNEFTYIKLKKFVQTVSYLPHFVSWVIFGGLVISMLSVSSGPVNAILIKLGVVEEGINFLGKPQLFWLILTFTGLIKGLGFGAIIYIASIAGVDQEIYEAAIIDGAGRFQKMWYVTIPSIMGTIVIMLIFAVSSLFNTGFEQIFILQNPLNIDMSETIDTYVYKVGLGQMRFSYSAAVGVVKSIVSAILLVMANFVSNKISDKGLF